MLAHDGSNLQAALRTQPEHYSSERVYGSMLGVVLNVYYSDAPNNLGTAVRGFLWNLDESESKVRGSRCEASVLIVDDGGEPYMVLEHVPIGSSSPSGIDNFEEELPHPTTVSVRGQNYPAGPDGIPMGEVDPMSLDGAWCVVSFIGGSIYKPYISCWFQHPMNYQDAASAGAQSDEVTGQPTTRGQRGALNQVGAGKAGIRPARFFKRFQGTKFVITPKGSIFIDTNEANAKVEFLAKPDATNPDQRVENVVRIPRPSGGNIQIDMKATTQLERNWNPPVLLPSSEPSLPQPNPPFTTAEAARGESLTVVRETANKVYASTPELELIGAVSALLKSNISTTVEAPDVALGSSSATDLALRGTSFTTALTVFLAALGTYVNAITTPAGPLVDPGGAAKSALTLAITAFTNAAVSSLSAKVRLE